MLKVYPLQIKYISTSSIVWLLISKLTFEFIPISSTGNDSETNSYSISTAEVIIS